MGTYKKGRRSRTTLSAQSCNRYKNSQQRNKEPTPTSSTVYGPGKRSYSLLEREREREGLYQRSWGHFFVILKLEFISFTWWCCGVWCLMHTRTSNNRKPREGIVSILEVFRVQRERERDQIKYCRIDQVMVKSICYQWKSHSSKKKNTLDF